MGRFTFKLPDVGEGTAEAEIVKWHVAAGDVVQEDQLVVEVMTDKATVEITSPVSGAVVECRGEVGTRAPVGGELMIFETDAAAPAPAKAAAPASPTERPAPAAAPRAPPQEPASGKAMAAPAVRAYAREHGADLGAVTPTGQEGRVVRADVDAFLAQGAAASDQGLARSGVQEIKMVGLRRRIAEKMQAAVRRIPHASYVEEIDVTELETLRRDINAAARPDQPRLTPLPFFVRALVEALPGSPQLNAHYDDEAGILRRHAAIHLGIATQTPDGLMAPVLRDAEARDLWNIAAEIARLSQAAREGRATAAELSGSTITLSSLGALGGVASTPIINWPEVAIVAPNRIVERPAVHHGAVTVRKMMNMSMSFDHRVIDGHDAALFMQQLKQTLEHPAALAAL